MARPPLTLQKLITRQEVNIQETSDGELTIPDSGKPFIPPEAIHAVSADHATSASYAVSSSHEIIKEISSSHANFADTASLAYSANTASYVNPLNQNVQITGSLSVNGSSRTLFTSCSMVYSGSNVTQVTQSYQAGTQQITNILYSGSFADGNPFSVAVTGSDGVNKLYSMTYSEGNITQILVT
jgi:hypothetical protein